MRVPTRLPIAGRSIRIEYVDKIVDGNNIGIWGESVSGENHIRISRSRPVNEAQVWETLHHELVHVVMDISGVSNVLDEKVEEAVAHALDMLLSPIISLRPNIPGARYAEVEFDYEDD